MQKTERGLRCRKQKEVGTCDVSADNLHEVYEPIARHIEEYRPRLSYIVSLHMHPMLHKRISVEDVMQEQSCPIITIKSICNS